MIIIKKDHTDVLTNGGFKLTKWATTFGEQIESEKALTMLGMECINITDTLKVCRGLSFEPTPHWKQQKVLSVVSSVFDALEFLAPFVIRGRIILNVYGKRVVNKGTQTSAAI